jgi:hypothetical protein
MRVPRRVSSHVGLVVTVICIVVLAIAAGYFFKRYNDLKHTPTVENTAKSEKIVNEVGKIFLLPTGDDPTVAIIKDTTKLASQPFFKRAHNGDAVVIYAKAHVAVIYREKDNKVINATDAMSSQATDLGQGK